MKKLLALSLLMILLLGLTSCSLAGVSQNSIAYGKRYLNTADDYYIFNADKTGYREYRYCATNYTISGRIEFVWRKASDGAVYLFATATHYGEDHTEGRTIPFIEEPICFGEDFFAATSVGGRVMGSSFVSGSVTTDTVTYIEEGSELAGLLAK